MSALSKIQTEVLADALQPAVSQDEAERAQRTARLDEDVSIHKINAKKTIGKHLAHDDFGYLVHEGILTIEQLGKLRRLWIRQCCSKDIEKQKVAVRGLATLLKSNHDMIELMLKGGEVAAIRSNKASQRSRAPSSEGFTGQAVQTNVDIHITGTDAQIEKV